jgi:histidyl-tRNA synthetase
MASQQTRPARGMRDFLPEDVRRRDYVIGIITSVYQRYGFEPLETPALENIETLTGKYGEEGNKLIFKVLRRGEHESSGETDLALRYDLTVPLARVVAEYRGKLPKYFKRYQVQPVWRADRPARGRFREFYQCDVDAIGSRSPVVEAEMLSAVSDVLGELGFNDFTIQLNLDKIGVDGVLEEMVSRTVPRDAAKALLDNIGSSDVASFRDGEGAAAADNLGEIMNLVESTSAAGHVKFAPRLARGLSYYTGAIMEVTVPDLAGSLGGGGRYDGLIGMFLGEDVPACGFSLGLERILVVMTERKMFPAEVEQASADVLLTVFDAPTIPEVLKLAAELRQGNVRVEIYPEADKLGKQMKYASSKRIRFAAILGGDEIARKEVTIKNLETGEQQSVRRPSVAELVKNSTHSSINDSHPQEITGEKRKEKGNLL